MKLRFQVLESHPSGHHKVAIDCAECPTLGLQVLLGIPRLTVLNDSELATLRGLGALRIAEREKDETPIVVEYPRV